MAEHDLHELVGPVVAQVVLDHLLAAHVLGFAVIERGDHVPGRAPLGHQIERGEQARHMERLVVARRIGGAEAKPLGRHAHDREHRHRIHLHAADAVPHRVLVVAAVHVRHRQPVIEEAEMEFSFFKDTAEMPIVIGGPGIRARLRVAPGACEIRAHLLRLFLLHPVPGPVQQMKAHHVRARAVPHFLHGARGLVDAPVALARDEHRRHIDGAAGEGVHLGDALGVRAAPHPIALKGAIETGPRRTPWRTRRPRPRSATCRPRSRPPTA